MHSKYYFLTAYIQMWLLPCSSRWKAEFDNTPVNAHCFPILEKEVRAFHNRFSAPQKASVGIYYVKSETM